MKKVAHLASYLAVFLIVSATSAAETNAQSTDKKDVPKKSAPETKTKVMKETKIQVNCAGGNSFNLSTGTNRGECHITMEKAAGASSWSVTGGYCHDDGNTAGANCTVNAGSGACGGSTGAGSCSK